MQTEAVVRRVHVTRNETIPGLIILNLRLWINPDWEGDARGNGVPYDDSPILEEEIDQGQQAIVRRFWLELPKLDVRQWIRQEAAKVGGLPTLTALLLGVPLDKATRATLEYRALKRSLERSGPAQKPGRREKHSTIVKRKYIDLIDAYAKENSPFNTTPGFPDWKRLEGQEPILAVMGHWQISKREYDPRELDTAFGRETDDTKKKTLAVLRNDGRDFIETVRGHVMDMIGGIAVVLIHKVYSLSIQAKVKV